MVETMASAPDEILVEAAKARRQLKDLCLQNTQKLNSDDIPNGVELDSQGLTEYVHRFNIWASSLGVFQKGDASLDSRLSNHRMSREITRLLKQLHVFTSELIEIVKGSRQQRVWTSSAPRIEPEDLSDYNEMSSDSDDTEVILIPPSGERSSDDQFLSESRELYLSIDESITSLLRLSVLVSKSSRKSKFARSSNAGNYSISPDINHVLDLFPCASNKPFLLDRLAKANAQRRQWLWYRRRHRQKLSVDASGSTTERLWRPEADENDDAVSLALASNVEGQPEYAAPSLTGTRASTFRSDFKSTVYSQSKAPETVFGLSSMAADDEQHFVTPEPPNDLILGQPYFCRYCCNMVELSGRNAWQRHVHADLSSYTCTFPNCDEVFFESRHKWWNHEMEHHRKQWQCGVCGLQQPDKMAMETHLLSVHDDQIPKGREDVVVNRFGRPVSQINADECSLCDYSEILRRRHGVAGKIQYLLSPEKFSRHLGRHLEQLALFVLPSSDLISLDQASDAHATDDEESADEYAESEHEDDMLSDLELVQKLVEIASAESSPPERLSKPPELALRWQPPQDFTPPLNDFYTDDVDLLPTRQEPLYGGDLHTSGWARGLGYQKEGFCARCPVSHWVNIADGSYAFHLTYFHGVPDSGVPLPRPTIIRPIEAASSRWEGYCEACLDWKLLKKTKRGWNWYRHWLDDHKSLVKCRTDAVRSISPSQSNPAPESLIPLDSLKIAANSATTLETEIAAEGGKSGNLTFAQMFTLARDNKSQDIEKFLKAVHQSHTAETMKQLLAQVDHSGQTLLMVSAGQGLDKVAALVLSMGGDPNIIDMENNTALDLATDAGYFRTARILIDGGADVSKSPIFKRVLSNPREYAGEMTNSTAEPSSTAEMVEMAPTGQLGKAANDGDLDSVRRLLGTDDGPCTCDIEEGAESGLSPFLLTSRNRRFEVMALLLSRGANINTTSKQGWTPLMLACRRDDEICVMYLLNHGADVNHLSPDKWSALAEATVKGSIRVMRLLLEAGADPEVKAQSDWTPLMHACFRGHIDCVELLLGAGASHEGVSAHDETPMLLAAASGSPTVVRRLLDDGCAPDSVWSIAQTSAVAEVGDASRHSITAEQRIERTYRVGWTPLMVASQIGNSTIVAMLLDAGASTEPKSPMMKTALEIARENGRTEVAELLASWPHKQR
ncbi:ankyrin repeat-containing domain protein [Xylariaceae sp. FL0255]|nr:ankyrin repeat-containing domain protein [Xylariaceae sp. FL0255]